MKFNFKKIATVLGSALMIGSTIGVAAAANYPEPFVQSGSGDVGVVIGANSLDMAYATTIADSLSGKITVAAATTSAALTGEGDKVQLTMASDKINIGNGLKDVWGTSITKSNLPTLLASGVFNNKQNSEYKYDQQFDIDNVTFNVFSDSEYKSREPTLGFQINSNTEIANYTLDFVTDPQSSVSSSDLVDFETKTIKILGKEYYILDFDNSTTPKATLLDAATTASLTEGETKTVTAGANTYTVSIGFISSDEVILNVNGVPTEKLSATGTTYGNTYKLSDGSYVGIKTINVQNYAGGSKSVDFSLGKGKLELTNNSAVKINDKSIDDLTTYFDMGYSNSKQTWQKLKIQWKVQEKKFLTPERELLMPGFEAIKFTLPEIVTSVKEVTSVDYGSSDYIVLDTKIKDGDLRLPILYLTTTTGNYTGIGQSSTQLLATTDTTRLVFNASSGINQGFIASWANTKQGESYYLTATIRNDTDGLRAVTTVKNKITGATMCEDITAGSACTIGNVVLTAAEINWSSGQDSRVVTFTLNSGGSFNKLYTPENMIVYLPFANNTATCNDTIISPSTSKGQICFQAANASFTEHDGGHVGRFVLWFGEEDKDGTLDQKAFNVTLDNSGSGTTYYATVANVYGAGTQYETTTGSKVWVSYVSSDLATRVTQDKTNSNQYSAKIEYHGSQVYANVWVTAPSVTNTGASSGTIVPVKDSEIASVQSKNLIVVGGSCINSVAAKLLGSDTPICEAEFTAKAGVSAGQFLIQSFASPYSAAKTALLVAGYDAADTSKAATYLVEKTVDTTVGKSIKKASATYADII